MILNKFSWESLNNKKIHFPPTKNPLVSSCWCLTLDYLTTLFPTIMVQWKIAQLIFHLTPFSKHICGRKSSSSNFSSFKLSSPQSRVGLPFSVLNDSIRFRSLLTWSSRRISWWSSMTMCQRIVGIARDFFKKWSMIKGPLVLFAINIYIYMYTYTGDYTTSSI